MPIYAIGDIHGQLGMLKRQHDLIAADQARYGAGTVVHVGDLVDRGPDSAGVIDYLRAGLSAGADWVVLKGNHDRMFGLFLADPLAQDEGLRAGLSWLHPQLGGAATLASYGVRAPSDRPVGAVHRDALSAVPAEHRAFLAGRTLMYRTEGLAFVHAGIRPRVPLDGQTETDLVWIRGPFLTDRSDHGALIVHGHTALDMPTHYGNRVNIDTGAGYGRALSAVAIEGDEVFHLTDRGRFPLVREMV